MGRYTLSRLAQLLPVLWLISLIVFVVMHALPGDPAELMLAGRRGRRDHAERLAELRAAMGLDDPLAVQYLRFLAGARGRRPRRLAALPHPGHELILDRFASTLGLALCGLLIAVAIGLPLGMLAAVRQNSWIDALSMASAYLGASMPVFWLGLLLILFFSFTLQWFPPAAPRTGRRWCCRRRRSASSRPG
jgi:ABC-type dipeptide/oligopeptide/nickel transport system permease component